MFKVFRIAVTKYFGIIEYLNSTFEFDSYAIDCPLNLSRHVMSFIRTIDKVTWWTRCDPVKGHHNIHLFTKKSNPIDHKYTTHKRYCLQTALLNRISRNHSWMMILNNQRWKYLMLYLIGKSKRVFLVFVPIDT